MEVGCYEYEACYFPSEDAMVAVLHVSCTVCEFDGVLQYLFFRVLQY
jgi:hypothetical protein